MTSSNYLRGFQKRKQQRREKAEEKLKKKAAEERVAERKEMREEVHNRWERAVKDMTEAFGNSEESDLLNLPAQKPHTADEGASVPERTEEKVFENEGDDDLFGGVMVTTSTSLFEEDSAAVDARIAELRHEVSKDHREPLTSQQSNKKIMTKREGGVKKFGTSKRIDKTLGKKKTVHKKGVKSKSKKKH